MKTLYLLALSLLPAFLFGQGAIDGYMKNKGDLDIALSYSMESSDKYYAGKTEITLERKINSLGLFAAYGISKRINVITSIPYINGELQDGAIYVKGLFYQKHGLNLIGALGYSGPLSDYRIRFKDAIGQKAESIQPRLVGQYHLKGGFYLNGSLGYNFNGSPVPDNLIYSFKGGVAKNKLYADLWIEFQKADGGKDYRGVGDKASSTFRDLGVEYTRIGGVLYYSINKRIGAFAGWGATLDGRNTGNAFRVSLGGVFKFNLKK